MNLSLNGKEIDGVRIEGLKPGAARLFRLWLLVLIGLVLVMVTVGGATRLTGSGLSITEWKPILGAVPPLTEADWLKEFALYRESPQYKLLNSGMALGEFKFIYWWEWGHRQLGRFIGLVMLGGFLAFFLTGAIRGRFAALTFGLGLLLGLQGVIGWIMVASGLEKGMIAVAPIKLTLHLVFACLFFIGLVVMAAKLECDAQKWNPVLGNSARQGKELGAFGRGETSSPGLRRAAIALVVAVLALMDGEFVPGAAKLFVVKSFWENFADNPTLVQFNHRMGAYLLLAFAFWHALAARGTGLLRRAWHLFGLILAQGALGIVTLLLVVPLWAGLAHQALAMIVLAYAVTHAVKAGG